MFEGIMLFNQQSSLVPKINHLTKGTIHGFFMFIGALCSALGFSAIYVNKDKNDKPHFQTWHAWFGIATLVYATVQTIAGVFLKYHNKLKIPIKLKDMKLYHATSGLLAFTLMSITMYLALFSTWFSSVATGTTWFAVVACLSCMALTVMMQVTSNYLPQAKNGPQTTQRKKK